MKTIKISTSPPPGDALRTASVSTAVQRMKINVSLLKKTHLRRCFFSTVGWAFFPNLLLGYELRPKFWAKAQAQEQRQGK